MFYSRIQFSGIFKDEPLATVAGVSLVLVDLVVQLLSFLTKGMILIQLRLCARCFHIMYAISLAPQRVFTIQALFLFSDEQPRV